MATIKEMIRQANIDGYMDENAEAKVCQDVVLKALSKSALSRNATIKGGVVMRSISHNARNGIYPILIENHWRKENDRLRKTKRNNR